MKLWIIYKDGIGFSKMVAEMLQDRLEDYLNVSLGNAKKIIPSFLVEERLDYLIIGDVISSTNLDLEIQNWFLKYWGISNKNKITPKMISGFYIRLADISVQPLWVEFLQNNVKNDKVYPPILCLKLNAADLSLENGALELIKEYVNSLIEFLINNK